MHMEDWIALNNESMPNEQERVLLTDGETILIGYYILSENHINWFFGENVLRDFDVQWWTPLPPLPPKIKRAETV